MSVTFDGANKIIAITTLTSVNFHTDIYVPAIQWASLTANMKYLAPVSGAGKKEISTGVYTDSIFTIMNGWNLQFNGYLDGEIITILGTITNGAVSIVDEEEGDGGCPIISFTGYTNATIVNSSANDPWNTQLPGSYPAGSAGKILSNVDKKTSSLL